MARKLRAGVFVEDENGLPVLHAAGTVPPDDVAEKITNEAAWEAEQDDPQPQPQPDPKTPRKRAAKAAGGSAQGSSGGKAGGGKASSQDGQASSGVTVPADDADVDAWRAYAETVGATPAADADVEAIKADLADRGLLDADPAK